MLLKTHIAFGLLAGLAALKYINIPNKYAFLALACLSAALPDIDKSDSKIGKKTWPLSWMIEKLLGHRNFFHSAFPPAIAYLIFFHLLQWELIGYAFLVGYGSHLLIDMLNYTGISLFYPFTNKRISGFIRTGSLGELVLFTSVIVTDTILLLKA